MKEDIYTITRNLMCYWIFIMMLITLIFVQCENVTRAQQIIISEDTLWTVANSPYIISGNVLIEHGLSLTIEPGVKVKFDGFYYMQIEGTLIAEGTENEMITFTTNNNSPSPGDWNAIRFMDNAEEGSIINYCIIEYGTVGINIDVLNIAAPNITNSNINHNSQTGIKYFSRASNLYTFNPYSEISNNTITDNGQSGIEIQYNIQIANANLLVNNNLIEKNGAGIIFNVYEGNLSITHNTIIQNSGSGLWCNGDNIRILYNLVLYNDGNGIFIAGSHFNSMVIEHNTILYNSDKNDQNGGGVNFEQHEVSTIIIFRYNNIYSNTPYDARNGRESDIDISLNWWGTTESKVIEQHIYDYNDDLNRGRLNYTTILTDPDPDAPDPSTFVSDPPDTPITPIDTDEIKDVIVPIFLVVIVIIIVVVILISNRNSA